MLKIKNLTKEYGGTKVVDNLSLDLKEGVMFGFLGPNGAGKTTTMKIMIGLTDSSKGSVKIDELDSKTIKVKEQIGYMPEDPYFYDHLTALEFMNFMASLFKKKCHPERSEGSKDSSSVTQNDSIINLLKTVGLNNVANKKIGYFSKGMKQRLGLAQALVNDPKYIFLDEPLDGLDPIGRREFKQILLGLKKKGKTIFFNSHILSDVEEICDQIGIINEGKLIYSGSVKQFRGNKTLEDAFVDKLTKQ